MVSTRKGVSGGCCGGDAAIENAAVAKEEDTTVEVA
jgi:iron-sulfur cluster repair protein YtfE (RIC family)